MSKGLIAIVGAVAVVGFAFPSVFQRYQAELSAQSARDEVVTPPAPIVEAAAPLGRSARLKVEADGHYRTNARVNGRAVPVLVDTGATYVSFSEETARKLGIVLAPAEFRYKAETANGQTDVALTTVDRIQIGTIDVHDVEVMVSRGKVLSTTLLGMSFLNKLKRFGVEGETLNLVQ